mmetsp:Transcript_31205/g.67564  ORF Transcript_31205/g.67564 Transcript_31205/m.67564 type:complete len:1415 (-) Transcript_31205:330-4574(-)|eukprot:CAMPEP_0178515198 /NCGR_PEP_ID=MMETSP0696-20121128/24429_1 /TAXON_ID=265572 /ORGANISM="Extubocellulus spinifer, Strain CCMP396" /LENGTH=1414 /DNA_ID=CAMNT_0020145345 /DNA_START=224 /DNA_END=4471 /DNA_ORIENTATION=-
MRLGFGVGSGLSLPLVLGVAAIGSTMLSTKVMAQDPKVTPVETYFLPVGETALLESMKKVNSRATSPLNSMQSITMAADGTVLWFDHWEDGFETDIINPKQSSTLVIGDGDGSNGCAPANGDNKIRLTCSKDSDDVLTAGMALILENYIPTPRTKDDLDDFYYDGGDRVQASFPIAVTRGVHSGPESLNGDAFPGALLGGAVEVSNTKSWGTTFRAPVGLEMDDDYTRGYTLTDMYIQASEDNTEVSVFGGPFEVTKPDEDDKTKIKTTIVSNTNEAVETVFQLNMGETLRIEKIKVGDKVETSKPVQADLITGGIGSNYEMRWYSLLPHEQWTNDYYTPLSESSSRIHFYNSNNFDIDINVWMKGDSSPSQTFKVDANSEDLYLLPSEESGYRFESSDGSFYGVTQTDDVGSGQRNDWGHPLIPASYLTSKVIVGLAYGCKNNACPDNTGPPPNQVWITAADDAIVTVDYNTDGTDVDTFTVEKLESLLVYGRKPLRDMTGATISALDSGGNEVDIAVAWGQIHTYALAEKYNLDMGTVINPLPGISALKSCELITDRTDTCTNKVSPGDVLRCTIRITNTGQTTPDRLQFCESLSPYVEYELGSTKHGTDAVDDPTSTFTSPLDPDCYAADYPSPGMLVGGDDSVTYDVKINLLDSIDNGIEAIADSGTIKDRDGNTLATFDTRVQLSLCPSIELEKTVTTASGTCPGSESIDVGSGADVKFCFKVTNTGNTALNDIKIDDPKLGASSPLTFGGTLLTGDSWDVTAVVAGVTEAMKNTATVTGNPAYADGDDIPYLSDVTDTDTAQFAIAAVPTTLSPTASPTPEPIPNIKVEKTVTENIQDCRDGNAKDIVHVDPNATIYWCLTVTNDGQTPLSEVTLYDPQIGVNTENIAPQALIRRDLQSKETQVDLLPTDVEERALEPQSSGGLAYNRNNDPFTHQSRNLAIDICSGAPRDDRIVLLDEDCGASVDALECHKHYISLKDDKGKNDEVDITFRSSFDATGYDSQDGFACLDPEPDDPKYWVTYDYFKDAGDYVCQHEEKKCDEKKDLSIKACIQHPDNSNVWYTEFKLHVHTVRGTDKVDSTLCPDMEAKTQVCTFSYAIDCTDDGDANYQPGELHNLMAGSDAPSTSPTGQPTRSPTTSSPTTPATGLLPGESYSTAIKWVATSPMVNTAKAWGYGPNKRYVSDEDRAENTIIGEQIVFVPEATNGTKVFVDESLASEAPSSAPSGAPSVSFKPSVSSSPSSGPSSSPSSASDVVLQVDTTSPSSSRSSLPSSAPSASSRPTAERTDANTMCREVSMTAVDSIALKSFEFEIKYSGCVSVEVDYSIDGGNWMPMCTAHDVWGQWPLRTVLDGANCMEITIMQGQTVSFRLSTEPSNTCKAGKNAFSVNTYGVLLHEHYSFTEQVCATP